MGRTERRSCKLGWRVHTVASMLALPIAYIVRTANVNNKELVEPLVRPAASLLKRHGKRISHVIADQEYYSAEVFRVIGGFGAEPVIPHPLKMRAPLINLYITKRFRVKGDPRLVELYKLGKN